jgi:hypothetical protein
MNCETAQQWLDDYIAAWISYDRAAIGALFGDDIAYRYHPHDEPIKGRAAVVASWLGEGQSGDGSSDVDAPGTFEAHYRPVAVEGNVVVAQGVSSYRDTPDGPIVRIYDNCFVMRFDDAARCEEFTEFYARRPVPNG